MPMLDMRRKVVFGFLLTGVKLRQFTITGITFGQDYIRLRPTFELKTFKFTRMAVPSGISMMAVMELKMRFLVCMGTMIGEK